MAEDWDGLGSNTEVAAPGTKAVGLMEEGFRLSSARMGTSGLAENGHGSSIEAGATEELLEDGRWSSTETSATGTKAAGLLGEGSRSSSGAASSM